MKILALDTAMAACSVAVVDTDLPEPLAAAFIPMERGHAEALAPLVRQVMAESGIAYGNIDRIAATIGPGTFTGVRIGLAMARGIGLARGTPVIGIDTLRAIAANHSPSGIPLLVAADARNGEVYAAAFDGTGQSLRKPAVMQASAAADGLPPSSLIIGTAAEAVIAASGRSDLVVSSGGGLPNAAVFAALAARCPATGDMPAPLYLRSPDAKPQAATLRRVISLDIQKAGPESAALLASMHTESFETGWKTGALSELLAMPGAAAAVALEHDEPLGFVLTRTAADEAEIITVCTRPFAQRRGVAKRLLAHQLEKLSASGVRHIFLEVAQFNAAARGLYAALGFADAGKRSGYYKHADGTTDDAIIMRRNLSP